LAGQDKQFKFRLQSEKSSSIPSGSTLEGYVCNDGTKSTAIKTGSELPVEGFKNFSPVSVALLPSRQPQWSSSWAAKLICYCPLKVGSFMLHMQTRSSEHKSGAKHSVLIGSVRVPHFVKATASDTYIL
jgi:hypothetical protein